MPSSPVVYAYTSKSHEEQPREWRNEGIAVPDALRNADVRLLQREIAALFPPAERQLLLSRLTILGSLSQFIGRDFRMPVVLNTPGGGFYWNFEENFVAVDAQSLVEGDFVELRVGLAHEGAHRRITRNSFISKQLWRTPGFSFLANCIEDPRVDSFLNENYPYLRDHYDVIATRVEEIAKRIEAQKANLQGQCPVSFRAGLEYCRAWYAERTGTAWAPAEGTPPEAVACVAKTLDAAREAWNTYPSMIEADASRMAIVAYSYASHVIVRDRVWPEFKKLVEQDLQQLSEAMYQAAQAAAGVSGDQRSQEQSEQTSSAEAKSRESREKSEGDGAGQNGEASSTERDQQKKSDSKDAGKEEQKSQGQGEQAGGQSQEQKGEGEGSGQSAEGGSAEEQTEGNQQDGGSWQEAKRAARDKYKNAENEINKELAGKMNPGGERGDKQDDSDKSDAQEQSPGPTADPLRDYERRVGRQRKNRQAGDPQEGEDKANGEERHERQSGESEQQEGEGQEEQKNGMQAHSPGNSSEQQKNFGNGARDAEFQKRIDQIVNRDRGPYYTLLGEIAPLVNQTEQELRQIFRKKRESRAEAGHRYGQEIGLERRIREMARGIHPAESHAWLRRSRPEQRNTAIVLLQDLSGSMHRSKIEAALRGVIVLSEVCQRLSVPFEVWGFNNWLFEYKTFPQKFNDSIRSRIGEMLSSCHGDTCMNGAIQTVSARLRKVKAEERFLVVLTDGEPSQPIRGALEECASHHITVGVGIGPESRPVARIFPRAIAGIELEDFPRTFADLMRRMVQDYQSFTGPRRSRK